MIRKLLAVSLVALATLGAAAQPKLLLRHPAINNDGSVVAFSYQGDIWTVPATGGRPSRLTIHEAYEGNPVFSPDGKSIAFAGSRFGNADVFTIPAEGGTPRRLTYHSSADSIASWTHQGQLLFSTSREFRQIEGQPEMYAISAKGGTEQRFTDVLGYEPTASPNGRFIAFVRGQSNPVFREDYKGAANREVWIYDTKVKSYNRLPLFETNDVMPRWSGNNTLYFLSSAAGTYNLYKVGIDESGKASGKPQQLTSYDDEAIRHFNVSEDGSTIVFERDMNLYLMKTAKGTPQTLQVQMSADDRFNPTEQRTFTTGADQYALSPSGKMITYSIRGEVFIKEADKDKPRSINISNHAYRDMDPVWLNDSTLVFCSDRAGNNFDMYMVRSVDTTEASLFKTLKPRILQITSTKESETAPVVSNDGKRIAYIRGRGELVVAELGNDGKLRNEKVLLNGWATPGSIAWSPDNKWLAYSLTDLYANFEVYIHAADNSSKPVNVTMHPRRDGNPFWSADGSKLGFTSARNNLSNDVWFVWLRREDWEKVNEDWQEGIADPAPARAGTKPVAKTIRIDFDGISERTVQVTNFPGDEGDFVISKDGQTFYYSASTSTARGRDLYSIKWDGKDLKELTRNGSNPSSLTIDNEGKYLYFARAGGAMARIDARTGVQEALPYSSRMRIEYIAEREEIYEEAWRTIRDYFYDPKFHGYDWNALHDKYKERSVNASTGNDFRDMFNNMLGEINASHMAFVPRDRVELDRERTGLLGAELSPAKGGMKVDRVIPNGPATRTTSTLFAGDMITAVNGEAVLPETVNFFSLLSNQVNEKLVLTIRGSNGTTREVVIRPNGSSSDQLYDEWVGNRRKLVDQWSGGKLGYIHIQAMNIPSFESVERAFAAAGFGKSGLVIDVRYNGGGSTTDYLMSVLNYKQHAYTVPRGATDDLEKNKLKFKEYYPVGERLVYAAWLKPSIALCNEGSYSNAEIFSHAYKQAKIGKLVGMPTNGSVISTGAKTLLDGSTVRLPGRAWFTYSNDKNQELGPAVPDILVENPIDWITTGEDRQLKTAVEELMKDVKGK